MGAIMKKGQADAEQEQRKLVQVKRLRSTHVPHALFNMHSTLGSELSSFSL
jgi:hypothetical protein